MLHIGNDAFENCKEIKEIIIPNKVEKIGQYAFSVCSNLSKIILGIGNQLYFSRFYSKR